MFILTTQTVVGFINIQLFNSWIFKYPTSHQLDIQISNNPSVGYSNIQHCIKQIKMTNIEMNISNIIPHF